MAQTIATAYVQIMPTTKGIKSAIESEVKGSIAVPLEREAATAGLSAGRTAGTNLARGLDATVTPLAGKVLKNVEVQSVGTFSRIRQAASTAVQAYGGGGAVLAGLGQQASRATKEVKGLVSGSTLLASTSGALKGGLGAVSGLLGGPWGIAIAGAGLAINGFVQAQQNADAAVKALNGSLDEQTGKFTGKSLKLITDQITNDLNRPGDLELLKGLGVTVADATVALTQGSTATDAYVAHLQELLKNTDLSTDAGLRQSAALQGLINSVRNQAEVVGDAASAQNINAASSDAAAEAARRLGVGTDAATNSVITQAAAARNAAASATIYQGALDSIANAGANVEARINAIPNDVKITAKAVGLDTIRTQAERAAAALIAMANAVSAANSIVRDGERHGADVGATNQNVQRASQLLAQYQKTYDQAKAAIASHNAGVKTAGSASGGGSRAKAGNSALTSARNALLEQIRDQFFVSDLAGGTPREIATVGATLIKGVSAVFSGGKESTLVRLLRKDTADLKTLAGSRDKVASRLKAAQSNLDNLTQAKAQTVASATTAGIGDLVGARSASGVIRVVTKQLAKLKAFRTNLGILAKRGIPQVFLQQLVGAGLDGAYTAAALVRANDTDFTTITSLVTQLNTESAGFGKDAGVLLYDTGIAAAKGLVKGLQSQQSAIEAQMLKIAKAMQAAIRKALGIKSPSKVFGEIGAYTAQGLIQGIEGQSRNVGKAVASMVPTPNGYAMTAPNFTTATGSSTVHYVHSDDPYVAARHVVDDLYWKGRR